MSANTPFNYDGSRWVRVDLHLHSPGAHSFKYPDNLNSSQKDDIVNRYVKQLKDQGIEVAAITDYQQIRPEWFLPIRDAAQAEGIHVYPGVELSFGGTAGGKRGLHILAIFPYNADVEAVNRAIDKILDGNSTDPIIYNGNHRDFAPEKSLTHCLPEFRKETGALLIPAHPQEDKGLLTSFSPGEATELLLAIQPDAIENFDEKDRKKLADTAKINMDTLRAIASIENSDNHSIGEIGTKTRPDGTLRATYLKLSALDNLRSLRLALRDWEILTQMGQPPQIAYTSVETLQVDGTGFLGNWSVSFSPELNVLVGGRGAGKSAILEALRYALDLPAYAPTEYRENLITHALGSGGKVSLQIRQVLGNGISRCYDFERVSNDELPQIYEIFNNERRLVGLTTRDVLGEQEMPLFFGQKEIYDVTQSPTLLRRLLDEIIGRTAQQKLFDIKKLQEELQRNARAILERRQRLMRREEVDKRLREIENEEQLYHQLGVSEKLTQATALARDEERLNRAQAESQGFAREWQELGERAGERWRSLLGDVAQAESDQKRLLTEDARRLIGELQDGFTGLFASGRTLLEKTQANLEQLQQRWQNERQPLDEAIRQIKQTLGGQSLDPDKLIGLASERQRLLPELEHLNRLEAEIAALQIEREDIKARLREARREAFKLRQQQAERISKQLTGRVKVDVEYRAQRKEYAELLAAFFTGSKIPRDVTSQMAHALSDGIDLAQAAHTGKENLIEQTHLSDARADQMLNFLNQEENRWFDLELLSPDDAVEITLNVNDRWQALQNLSAGLRATAMLLILLTQTERLLLVDQPEDDLDNRFIFDDVVKLLRQQKGKRQLIAATHNPNIPVLAHAELVLALDVEEQKAILTQQGGMDNHTIQDFVRKVMEGGEEAFRRRAEKYGLEI